jgi:hypothetical protein
MKFRLLRFINVFLLVCVTALTLTGVYGLFWTLAGWAFDLHRLSGWALIAALPWKIGISWRSLRRGLRGDFDRGVMIVISLLLAAVSVLVLALGLAWNWRLGPQSYWLRQTAVSWHWMLALGMLVPFALHAWWRWPRPKKVDFLSRRAALKMLGLGSAALFGWWAAERLANWRLLAVAPPAERRFTGSRQEGHAPGNDFPVTHTVAPEPIDPAGWKLVLAVNGEDRQELSFETLLRLPSVELEVHLDCTLGWYTVRSWRGVYLRDLLAALPQPSQVVGVRMESVTGYANILPAAEIEQVLLATHVDGEPLDHWHGFPLRVVVPSQRGWFWVKWLKRVELVTL